MTEGAVVLSHRSQYEAWAGSFPEKKGWRIYCDNPRSFSYLDQKELGYERLEEYGLEERWKEINAWGCAQAAAWRTRKGEKGPDLGPVFYLWWSHLLVQGIKNYFYAKSILEGRPSQVVIFRSLIQRRYPSFSGNAYLNYFLETFAREGGVPTVEIEVEGKENLEPILPVLHSRFLLRFKARLKSVLEGIVMARSRPERSIRYLFHGSLKHLGPVMAEFRRRRLELALYDSEFHLEQYRFARKAGISYLIPTSFPSRKGRDREELRGEIRNEVSQALHRSHEEGYFVFDGFNFGQFFKDCVFPTMDNYFLTLADRANQYESILKSMELEALIVDENYALKGSFLTAYFESRGVKTFCVSHANSAMDFQVPPDARVFGHSITFTQSEFEKSMFQARGWDPERIKVLGMPRYDRLLDMNGRLNGRPRGVMQGKLRLLYCATGIWLHSPDQMGYLGTHIQTYGGIQIPALEITLEAIKDRPVELVIKPHSFEAVPSYHRFIRERKPAVRITIRKHSDDFFRLLVSSDAMIIAYWSTALIESALCRIPTIFVDTKPYRAETLYRFAAKGYLRIVRTAEELERELDSLSALGPRAYQDQFEREEVDYFLGPQDRCNSKRVTDYIVKAAGE